MLDLLRTLNKLLGEVLALVNGWLADVTPKTIPTAAERKRLFLRQQLVTAHFISKSLLSLLPDEMHVPPMRSALLWTSVDQAISDARQQDPQFDSVVIQIGPPDGNGKGAVPFRLYYEVSLDELGYGTE